MSSLVPSCEMATLQEAAGEKTQFMTILLVEVSSWTMLHCRFRNSRTGKEDQLVVSGKRVKRTHIEQYQALLSQIPS